jgi:hypothetical protein
LSDKREPTSPEVTEDRLVRELEAIPYEPLLPVEKALIVGSLVMGVTLLGVLLWASNTFFPVSAAPSLGIKSQVDKEGGGPAVIGAPEARPGL